MPSRFFDRKIQHLYFWLPALRTACIYALVAGVWIVLSDWVLLLFFPNAEYLTWLQTAKGWFFVGFTAVLLFWLIRRDLFALQAEVTSCSQVQERFRALVETIPHGIQESDCDGVISFVNAGYDRIFGYAPGAAVGTPIWGNLADDAKRQGLREYFFKLVEKQPPPTPFESRCVTGDGRTIDIQIDWDYLRDGNGQLSGFASIITDITERKEAERAIRSSDRLKSELINTAAHEFRTPLTTILGFSELLHDQPHLPEEVSREYTGHILAKTLSLSEMVDNLLNLSRIEADQPIPVHFSRCQVGELIREVEPLISMMQKRHPVSIAVEDDDVFVDADCSRIGQVLSNLLDNAAKYSAEGSPIRLQGRSNGSRYRLEVVDSGIGIADSEIQKVFDNFYRVDSSDTSPSGFGIGLAIVKYLVEAHGGAVTIDSAPGKGTTIGFDLALCL